MQFAQICYNSNKSYDSRTKGYFKPTTCFTCTDLTAQANQTDIAPIYVGQLKALMAVLKYQAIPQEVIEFCIGQTLTDFQENLKGICTAWNQLVNLSEEAGQALYKITYQSLVENLSERGVRYPELTRLTEIELRMASCRWVVQETLDKFA